MKENLLPSLSERSDGSEALNGSMASINYFSGQEETKNKILGFSKHALAVLCICGIIGSQLGSTYVDLAILTDTSAWNNPYFLVWFNLSWNICCGLLSLELWKHSMDHIRTRTRSPLSRLIKPACALSCLWVLESYLFFLGTSNLGVSLSLLMSQSSTIWSFIFSYFILKTQITSSRVLAVVFCASGVVLTVLDNWSNNLGTMEAIIYSLIGAAGWGLYEVLFKKTLGDASVLEVNSFLAMVGCFVFSVLWFPMIFLNYAGVETFSLPPSSEVWRNLAIGALLTLLMHFLLNFANAFSSPLFVRIGVTLATPVSIVVDRILGASPGPFCYIGTALILIAFLFINIPEEMSFQWDMILGCRNDTEVEKFDPKPLRIIYSPSGINSSLINSFASARSLSDSQRESIFR